MEQLAWGYTLVEAVRGEPDGTVWFSDAVGGGVYRRAPDGAIDPVVPKRRGVGGLALHADGGVVVSGRDLVHVRDGETRHVLSVEGATGLNDLCAAPDGSVIAGVLRYHPLSGEQPVPGEFRRITADGDEVLFGGVEWVNGVCTSPDGSIVYAADYAKKHVLVWEGGGTRVFVAPEGASCDGLAMDEAGCLWVALGEGGRVARFTPTGDLDRLIDVPAGFVASIGFGGDGHRSLYIGTMDNAEHPERLGTLFVTNVDTPGMPMPRARV